MTVVSPAMRDLARRILAVEVACADETEPAVDVAVRASAKLQVPLERLTGVAGFFSLLSRAVVLAKAECPALYVVRVQPDGSLAGFDAIEQDQDAREFEKCRVALVAHLLGLLSTFIGESLARRFARDAWPDVSIDRPDQKEEAQQ